MSLKKNIFWTITTSFIITIISFFVNVPINRILGPELKGIYSYFFLIPGLFMVFSLFGLQHSATYYAANKRYPLQTIMSNIVYYIVFLFFVIISLFFFWVIFFKDIIFGQYLYFVLFAVFIFISLGYTFLSSVVQGLDKIKQYNIGQLFYNILNVILLVLILIFFHKSNQILNIVIIEGIIVYIPLVIYYIYNIPAFRLEPFNFNYLRDSIKYGLKIYLTGLNGYLQLNIDMLIISRLLTMADLGLYTLAVGIAEKFLLVVNSSAFALTPKNYSKGGDFETTAKVCRINLALGFFFIIGGILFIKPAIVFLYSEKFLASVAPLIILLPGIVILSVPTMISSDLAARNKVHYTIYSSVIALFSNILLNYVLIPKMGISGASLSSTITYFISAVVMIHFYKKVDQNVKVIDLIFINKKDVMSIFEVIIKKIKRKSN